MKQQELVWVRFPFSSFGESKIRPAVIVSNNDYNQGTKDVIACSVTSNLNIKTPSVVIDREDLESGTLPLKSRIRADKIMHLDKGLVIRPFGKIRASTFDALVKEIVKLLSRQNQSS
ncbi:type II toxin-antitoxin system PemK/MazF family toxin [Candidatus Woesearchaeota archaeon]|nr:type II toxin-antitoxin system PemK/MazF family toxin [Candidatus Woesearchaeota archaeon]